MYKKESGASYNAKSKEVTKTKIQQMEVCQRARRVNLKELPMANAGLI
jgi:hypothetical protein